MTDRPTDALLRELTHDLEPVRRIPSLRSAALLALVSCAVAAGLHSAATDRPFPLLAAGLPWSEGSFLVTLGGLALASGGALAAALAGAVPGRDVASRAGRLTAAAGVTLAVGGAAWWLLVADAMETSFSLASCVGCASHALLLALPPALVVGLFLGHALARRPRTLSAFAAMGALALGACVTHASCTDGGALHVALSHVAAPLVLAMLLALPLSWWVRHRAGSATDARD